MLFGNGDVQSLAEVVRRVHETGVDGVLVGRAALGAPWFFRGKDEARQCARSARSVETEHWMPSLSARFEILLEHAKQFEANWGREQFRRMRKHLGWYCKGFPHAAALRARMFSVSCVGDVEAALAEFQTHQTFETHQNAAAFAPDDVDAMTPLASRCG